MAASTQDVAFELDWPLKFATTTFVLGGALGFLGGFRAASNLYATEADKKRVWAQLKTAAMVGAGAVIMTATILRKGR